MAWTVGRLARRFGLSRATLLYYDSIGLLQPQARAAGEYRTYGEAEAARLERICLYRRTGLTLEQIKTALDAPAAQEPAVLRERLQALSEEMDALRLQQRLLAAMLQATADPARPAREVWPAGMLGIDKAAFSALLAAAGLSSEDRRQFHRDLEARAPQAHRRLLALLGFDPEGVETVLRWMQEGGE